MNHYLVILRLYLGEHEKTGRHLVIAEDAETAGKMALEGECHSNPEQDSDAVWDDGWMYKVHNVHEISEYQYTIMRNIWN